MANFETKNGFVKFVLAIIWICLTLKTEVTSQTVTLTPEVAEVIENGSVTLTCAYNGTETVSSSRWTSSAASTNPVLVLINKTCVAVGFLNNTNLYGVNCYGNNSFALTLKKVLRHQHDDTWNCRQENIESNSVNIFVKVPVTGVEITAPKENVTTITENSTVTTITENSTVTFTCTTSPGRPVPTVTWFLDSNTTNPITDNVISNNVSRSNVSSSKGLVSSTSTLTYLPVRNVNGLSLYCTASNVPNQRQESRRILLNVTYPPDGPPSIQGFNNGSIYRVLEHTEGRLACSVKGGNPLASLYWQCFNKTWDVTTVANVVKAEVVWSTSRVLNASCICQASHFLAGRESIGVEVEVLYSPSRPNIQVGNVSTSPSGTVEVIMNKTLNLYCDSSGNPSPRFTWTLPDGTTLLGQELQIANFQVKKEGRYICIAENEMRGSNGKIVAGKSTSDVHVWLLYPPTTPAFRYQNISGPLIDSKSLNVVRGDTFTVACTSHGRPEPDYTWDNQTVNSRYLTITSIATNVIRICYATNVMQETVGESRNGYAESSLSLFVLNPPSLPSLAFQYNGTTNVIDSDRISVIESTSFTLTCNAESKPTPLYSWYGPVTSTTSEITLRDIKREQKGNYACHAFNMMERSFGDTEKGQNERSLHLDVLYPPDIDKLEDKTIVEGDSLNQSCPVIIGNPANYTVTWTRDGDNRTWEEEYLVITTTNRTDSMTYICTVNNTMEPTFGVVEVGKSRGQFHLVVLYRATVVDFFVVGYEGQALVIINENETVEFRCNVDSNPKSNLSILFKEDLVNSETNAFTITYSRRTTTCLHAGVYICTGENDYNYLYNGKPSRRYITLHVRCFPRASPEVKIRDILFTAEHVPVVLSFTALAYPVPDPSDFRWRKYSTSVWLSLTNSDNITIVTSGLQSNLTIRSVTQADYGKYRLEIENSIGIFEQSFTVRPEEIPYPPTEFDNVVGHTTESSVIVRWKPGLNGGPEQTFILKYRKIKELLWMNVSVPDNGAKYMNYTIDGLTSASTYQIVIYSMNRLGDSAVSEELRIRTLGIPIATTETAEKGLPITAIIAGALAAVVVVVITTGVITVVKRKLCFISRVNRNSDRTELTQYENVLNIKGENVDSKKQFKHVPGARARVEQLYDEIEIRADKTAASLQHYEAVELNKDTGSVHGYHQIITPAKGPQRYLKEKKPVTQENAKVPNYENTDRDVANGQYENLHD